MQDELKKKIESALSDPKVSSEVKATLSEARNNLDNDNLSKFEKYQIVLLIISILTNVAQIVLK